ncbi:MAG: hypothetical protein CVU89_01930 [Firmicutes bacterium HGW-Firmicutes-14]|nr:MAG: hypothetical protein CVU89_01930 [Firmicutes bacterium HGW-Firmicutes-14]
MKNRNRILIWASVFIALVLGLALYGLQKVGQASPPGKEAFKVGSRTIVTNEAGDTFTGAYDDPIPDGPGVQTIVVSYTCVLDRVLFNELIPGFKKYWKDTAGEDVRFVTGYALPDFDTIATTVSGEPVRVLIMTTGTEPATRGFSPTKWHKTANKGIIYSSAQVFVVRKGNPKDIRTYADLKRPGIYTIHTNPFEGLGLGLWAVYGIYGSALKASEVETGQKDYEAALEQLRQVELNAFYGPTSGDQIIKMFSDGTGDVLVISESRARKLARENPSVEIVVPPYTVLSDMVVYTMDKNIKKDEREVVEGFIDYLFGEEAQEALAKFGFRPSDPAVFARHPEFPPLEHPFHLDYIGSATTLKKDMILDKWMKINNSKRNNQRP